MDEEFDIVEKYRLIGKSLREKSTWKKDPKCERIPVKVKETDGNKFYYIDIGYLSHRPHWRLWISSKLIKKSKDTLYIPIPCKNAAILTTKKGTRVMKPINGMKVEKIYAKSRHRAFADFKILKPRNVEIFEFEDYESPRCACGLSRGAFINMGLDDLLIYWKDSGSMEVFVYKLGTRILELSTDGSVEDRDYGTLYMRIHYGSINKTYKRKI